MYLVEVKFRGNEKIYSYVTQLPLIEGGWYYISSRNRKYETPVYVVKFQKLNVTDYRSLVEITKANIIGGPKREASVIDRVWYNEKKGVVTVKWTNGSKTTVHCDTKDTFDLEKAIAMCFVKKLYDNRGYYNDHLRAAIENAENTQK